MVIEPTFRLVGGGDTDPSFKAELLFMPILDIISQSHPSRIWTGTNGQQERFCDSGALDHNLYIDIEGWEESRREGIRATESR